MAISKVSLQTSRVMRSLWFTPALYAAFAIAALAIAPIVSPFIPSGMNDFIGLDGVYDLLDVLANTLLAVAIFSLGILASAMQASSSTASPRARPLIMQDRTAQNAISTFIGGFVFAIVGIVGLSTEFFDDASRVILFAATGLVILAVIYALIRWIGHLNKLGDVAEIINLVETTTSKAFRETVGNFGFSAAPPTLVPDDRFAIEPCDLGFVQTIDAGVLGRLAREHDCDLFVVVRPGSFVGPRSPLLVTERKLDEKTNDTLRDAFLIDGQRTFEADPRFGLIVLSEIASRALSPGINDPGTAIDVIGTALRVLVDWSNSSKKDEAEQKHPRVYAKPLDVHDVLVDAFRWIARDGAGHLEVQIHLQKALAALVAHDRRMFGEAAQALSREALERANGALSLPQDKEILQRLVMPRLAAPTG